MAGNRDQNVTMDQERKSACPLPFWQEKWEDRRGRRQIPRTPELEITGWRAIAIKT